MRRVSPSLKFDGLLSGVILALLLVPSAAKAQQCTNVYSALKINGTQFTAKVTQPPPVLAGSVTLNVQFRDAYEGMHTFSGVSLRYTLDDQPIGPVLTNNFSWTWDTTTAPEGTHVLSVLYVNEPPPGKPCLALNGREYTVVVENSGVPITGPQVVPLPSAWNNLLGARVPPRADYVTYMGSRAHATPHPYTYQFIPPAGGVPVDHERGWYSEPLVSNLGGEGEGSPSFYVLKNGSVVTEDMYQEHSDYDDQSYPYIAAQNNFDGPRDDSNTSAYSALVPYLDGPGFLGISIDGRLFKLNMDGSVQTLAGWVTRRDVVPYFFLDLSIPAPTRQAYQETLIGTFDVQFKDPLDLAIDPNNHNILYVADNKNNRIAKVDLSQSPPAITTFAGVPGVAGYRNGPASTALFNGPTSLVIEPDETMYVADGNNVIRKIDPSQNVSTLVGIGYPGSSTPEPSMTIVAKSPLTYAPRSAVPFSSAYINYPLPIRLDSKGNIVLQEPVTRTVRYIDLQAQKVTTLAQLSAMGSATGTWNWIDVDRWGNIGTKDDILVAESIGNGGSESIFRVPITGTTQIPPPLALTGDGSPLHNGNACCLSDVMTEYPWAVAIDDQEGRWVSQGFGSFGVASFHIVQKTDPAWQLDIATLTAGKKIWNTGTVPNFPYGSRPAFEAVHGYQGVSLLGSVMNFDDLSSMTDAQLATYIQNGAEGSIPRPEVTGNDLRNVIYFIRRSALGGDLVKPGPLSTDKTLPVITSVAPTQTDGTDVTVTWTTDKQTLGFAGWGTTAGAYFGWSQFESGYGTTHSVTMSNLPALQTIHFVVRSKDMAGNQSVTADQTITLH